MSARNALLAITVSVAIALLVALAGSDGGVALGVFPLFVLCALLVFVVHLVVFIPSYLYRTEHYFDLTGSLSYGSVVCCALLANPARTERGLLIGLLVLLWTLRLGGFLFLRIKRAGKDDRFDTLKTSLLPFLMTWTLSALWVVLTVAPALVVMTTTTRQTPDGYALCGGVLWAVGFIFETVADGQKMHFRAQPENGGRFIQSGLWAWSRHPNYFGEIVLWFGIAIIAWPVLTGWQHLTLLSPVFVWLLLTRISGIPLLERKAEERWGDDPSYWTYRDRTPTLLPWPPKKG